MEEARRGKRIGIAGNIGAGKSLVSRIVRLNGYKVFDCDMEARRIMESAPDVIVELKKILGAAAYNPAGKLDRGYVAGKIFNDEELRERVNSVVHSAVREKFLEFAEQNPGSDVFVESAIMASSGLDSLCDEIWVVDAPEDVRLERAMKRNGATERQIRERMEAQSEELGLLPAAKTVVIDNSGNSSVLGKVLELINSEKQ